jgi:hypothetical protein
VREAFSYPSFLPLALVLPLLVVAGARRSGLRVLLLTLAPAAAVVAALAVYLRAPEHVGLPALAFVPTALLVVCDDGPRRGGWARGLALASAAAAALFALGQHRAGSVAAVADNLELRGSVGQLDRDRLYVEWAGAFRYEAVLPLEDASYLSGLRLFSLGWPQRSPVADAALRERGIDDVVRALFERDDVGLLMNPAWEELLATYAREHYGATIRLAEARRTPSFTVFRVERAEASAGAGGPSGAAGR